MAEDEAIFEPKLTEKKKKKKTGFNLEAALTEATPDSNIDPLNGVENGKDEAHDDTEFLGKSKKKKKKPFNFDDLNEVLDSSAPTTGSAVEVEPPEEPTDDVDNTNLEMDLEFDYSSKKKKTKSKKKVDIEKLIADDDKDGQTEDREMDDAWGDSERDYSYDELVQRAFDQLRLKNPEMAAGEKIMKPPHVLRIGSKKSAFVNFSHICRLLHRVPQHVLQFLLAELGTSGSIDGNCQLIIKGRFQQKQIENVLRRYIKEYVTCHTCRSSDTILQKDARLYFLQCEQCNSRCSVAPIKSGFQAVANKQQRQAIRASKN
ncbi:eukaryotic translation initiation factor 2 subunit 2 isoform X2 [Hyalella azteca]|uniref:Eukaryotic translation initiation factor 2 subunit 2 n=1 Tax=Hyalella azteca TaxID=294128 RepID=A0A8B7N0X1_HYAAZ|nr:eukaryotic translation initiation factor 2 subunit 2 isoform X2 [Hyalella azteca]